MWWHVIFSWGHTVYYIKRAFFNFKWTELYNLQSFLRNLYFRGWKNSIGKNVNLQCIQDFLESSSEFVLFLDSDAILEDSNTFSKTVIQDLQVLSPLLVTNKVLAKRKKLCDFGWNRTVNEDVFFPYEQNTLLLETPRTFVSKWIFDVEC